MNFHFIDSWDGGEVGYINVNNVRYGKVENLVAVFIVWQWSQRLHDRVDRLVYASSNKQLKVYISANINEDQKNEAFGISQVELLQVPDLRISFHISLRVATMVGLEILINPTALVLH